VWNWFKAKRDHELALARLQAENQRLMVEAIAKMSDRQADSLEKVGEMVKTIAEAQQKSSDVLQTWLDGFKVMEMPQPSTVRDEDEVRMTIERTLSGENPILPAMPEGLPPELALAWQLRQTFPE
jgi:uncharacterized membrane protein YqiK